MGATLSDVAGAIELFAPLDLADPWDRPGLQVGDPGAPVGKVLVALDPSPGAVEATVARRAHLLVTHHPLLLHPLHRVDLSTPTGRAVAGLVGGGAGLYAAHTNLDRAEGGVSDHLARRLGLEDVGPLTSGEARCKLVVTVPVGYEPALRQALAAAGGGRLGDYRGCTFGCRGTGTFAPGPGSAPFSGRPGAEERAEETRLEAVVPRSRVAAAVRAVTDAHPYEEPALDVYALATPDTRGGLGRVGRLAEDRPLGQWAREAARCLGLAGARLAGDSEAPVRTVAVCGGSGADLWPEARRAGAQVLVTGDVKHHAALEAVAAGFALLDVGHGPGEAGAVEVLCRILRDWSARADVGLEVEEYVEPDPFSWLCP